MSARDVRFWHLANTLSVIECPLSGVERTSVRRQGFDSRLQQSNLLGAVLRARQSLCLWRCAGCDRQSACRDID